MAGRRLGADAKTAGSPSMSRTSASFVSSRAEGTLYRAKMIDGEPQQQTSPPSPTDCRFSRAIPFRFRATRGALVTVCSPRRARLAPLNQRYSPPLPAEQTHRPPAERMRRRPELFHSRRAHRSDDRYGIKTPWARSARADSDCCREGRLERAQKFSHHEASRHHAQSNGHPVGSQNWPKRSLGSVRMAIGRMRPHMRRQGILITESAR